MGSGNGGGSGGGGGGEGMVQQVDIVVLGLGPAGARAARAAAARGWRVVAFDRKQVAGQPVQCAELVPGLIGQDGLDAVKNHLGL